MDDASRRGGALLVWFGNVPAVPIDIVVVLGSIALGCGAIGAWLTARSRRARVLATDTR